MEIVVVRKLLERHIINDSLLISISWPGSYSVELICCYSVTLTGCPCPVRLKLSSLQRLTHSTLLVGPGKHEQLDYSSIPESDFQIRYDVLSYILEYMYVEFQLSITLSKLY